MKYKKNTGITLVALTITIIVLLLLAGITIGTLNQSGLFGKTKKAKKVAQIAIAKEEVNLAISEMNIENNGETKDITPKMIVEIVNKNNKRNVIAENEDSFPAYIIYPKESMGIGEKIFIKVSENLNIVEAKTESGITEDDSSGENDNKDNGVSGNTDVGKVNVTITNVVGKNFTINVNPENENNIAIYQYYVDGKLIYEGPEKQYTVRNLNQNTKYNVEVKVIPRSSISVAKLEQITSEQPIVDFTHKFDRYLYIDSVNGSDTEGEGSKDKPFASINKIIGNGIIEKGKSYGIILNSGDYNLTESIFDMDYDNEMSFIGNKDKTVVNVDKIYANTGGGKDNYKINFYRLIWNGKNNTSYNPIIPKLEVNLYNVVFKNIASNSYSYFCPSNNMNITNCLLPNHPSNMLRTTGGKVQLTNCYGGFTSGYGTSDSSWNYKTNYITLYPKVNGSTYQITDEENVWKNVGTGTNLDGTQASLGVYGGEYSWEYEDDIFVEM